MRELREIDTFVSCGTEGRWGAWWELKILDPGEILHMRNQSEDIQVAIGPPPLEEDNLVSGTIGPFTTPTRVAVRVKQRSFHVSAIVTEERTDRSRIKIHAEI